MYFPLHFWRLSPVHPLQRHCQLCGGGYTRASRCTGGISRASRHAKMSIQRIAPSHPPAISAEKMQIVQ
ncbi:MAG: hypothetical protein H0X30_17515 [Anaerolineae bacterium]|nr:hypothetical protein [Anaerolineae bacterium]